jgi:hypothetical protein
VAGGGGGGGVGEVGGCRAPPLTPARTFPIVQFPNPPLLLALAGSGLAAVADGTAHDVGRALFTIGLGVWAWEEAVAGVNWFRRLLGMGAFVWIVVRLAGAL